MYQWTVSALRPSFRLREHLDERLEDREVVVLGNVRLLRGRDERVRGVVEVAAIERGARALAQVVEVVEHPARIESTSRQDGGRLEQSVAGARGLPRARASAAARPGSRRGR